MAIRIVRLGSPRQRGEGVRVGAVRRPPRGVKKEDYARLDYYDAWLPELAPSERLRAWVLSRPMTPARWAAFARRYRSEMHGAAPARLISLLAVLSSDSNFSVGCYCEDESHCHRSLLRELLVGAGATVVS
jgi:uncharacterized protein YeaO (DUF488 family)